MIKKSEEEKELEKKKAELKRRKEEMEAKGRELEKMRYSLKLSLMRKLSLSFGDLEEHEESNGCYTRYAILTNAVLDQIVEIIFDIFPDYKDWQRCVGFYRCSNPKYGAFRMAIFDDETPGRPGLKRFEELDKKSGLLGSKLRFKEYEELRLSREDLKTLDISRDDLMRIVFAVMILAAVRSASYGEGGVANIHAGGPTH